MMKIEDIPVDDLRAGSWQSTHILRPDLLVLAKSIGELGFVSPITVMRRDGSIIDGYHRWRIVKDNATLRKTITHIPCVVIDCDSIEAAMLHLRLNRSRGSLLAHRVSKVVKNLIKSKKYTEDDLHRLLSMSSEEFDLLMDGTIIKRFDYKEHKYSRAWVPIEAPPGTVDKFEAERPPNSDR